MSPAAAKKTVLVLSMGGTISMRQGVNGPLQPDEVLQDLVTWIPELDTIAQLKCENVCNIDSSQMTPDYWLIVARRIKQAQTDATCDGVVVLHGTDTLAYTASALSFLLPDLRLPVVLTGGQKPLSFTRTDARNNVLGAVETAVEAPHPEVIVFFNNTAFRGNRCEKTSIDAFDAFSSPNYPALGHAGISWHWNRDLFWSPGRRPTIWNEIPASLPRAPWVLPWVPGLDFDSLSPVLAGQWAVILEAFGTGNMPFSKSTEKALTAYIGGGGLVFVRSQVRNGRTALGTYAPGRVLKEIGFRESGDMTREAMVTKLMVLKGLELSGSELVKHMSQSLVGEVTEKN